ncbi:MAG TPA: GIY-YIG nuclease family protein [Bacteroidia bacterium]|nr:GIY-YIG nuclease family protein [Bacteroidia bacterium]
MSYYVYVLRNSVTKKLYKGQTQNLERRLKEHSQSKTKTTSHHAKAWELVYHEIFETRELAVSREKYFKSAAGRRFLDKKV